MTYLGLQFLHGQSFGAETARLEELAKLASDPRWGVKFKLLSVGHVPGQPAEPLMRGPVAASDLAEKARIAFLTRISKPSCSASASKRQVTLRCSTCTPDGLITKPTRAGATRGGSCTVMLQHGSRCSMKSSRPLVPSTR